MAEILNLCIKCQCNLSLPDKISKLLPCLHTMCEDCITGRTDVAEKIKKMKEEKEQKIADAEQAKQGPENTTKEEETKEAESETSKTEETHTESTENKPESEENHETNDPISDETEPVKSPAKLDEENKSEENAVETTPATEPPSEKPDNEATSEISHTDQTEETAQDKESNDTDTTTTVEETSSAITEHAQKADDTAISTDENKDKNKDVDNASAEIVKENDKPPEEKETEKEDTEMQEESKEETKPAESDVPETNPSTSEATNMEVGEEEEEEEFVPPDPVPLTECPVCREPLNQESLIENIFIRKQANSADDGDGTDQKCTGCECNPATSFCVQCDDWLCTDCVNAHKRVRMTKDHQLTTLEEALANQGGSSGPTEVSMLCRMHPKEKLTLFCEKCEVLTCRDCQLLQHQEHKYQFLQEAAESYKAKLTGSLSLMKERREVLRRYQTEIEERLSKVKREKNDLQQDILRQADVIVKAVRTAVWAVLSSLHSFTDAAAKRLSREVGDVRDLVGKFDHCISFMDGILEDGFGLPLLFSKTIVESKCRKVYHTHMEPQSLKGQLNIQYRHDVPAVIRSLPHIGAIYVNGSKYPPEKSSPQAPSTASHSQSTTAYRNSNAVGGSALGGALSSQGIPPQLSPQDRSMYMQMMMGRPSHSNSIPSQGPTLSLPGSRRVGGMGHGPRGWGGQQLGLASSQAGLMVGSQGGLMAGMVGQGQPSHQMMGVRGPPAFTPMRLHHRPVESNHMSSTSPMVLGASHRHSHSVSFTGLPAPPPLRSPMGQPQYRGAAEGMHLNAGGQAAMSGVRRASAMMDVNPDPARPASGGHNTPERPLSGEGAAGSMRVKSEPHESGDCVITSSNFKNRKSPIVPGSSLGELRRNLDEVLRGVPLDLGDNLEQINGGDAFKTLDPPAHTTSPTKPPSQSPAPAPTPPPPAPAPHTENTASESDARERASPYVSAADLTFAEENDGRQVKGYATGNSMPGFTLAAVESVDPNDDYCAACHQGGDVLCCDQCPRVFHLQCHVPVLATVPSGTFVCTLCQEGLMTEGGEQGGSLDLSGKRKAGSLSTRDRQVCERVLLEMVCHPSSIPFHEPVNRAVPNYYKIITKPMDFNSIKSKLLPSHHDHYTSVEAFLDDCKLVFKNCAVYNSETSEVGKAGKIMQGFFDRLVNQLMPDYGSYARRQHESPDPDIRGEGERKRRRLTPPPPSQPTS